MSLKVCDFVKIVCDSQIQRAVGNEMVHLKKTRMMDRFSLVATRPCLHYNDAANLA